MAQGWLWLCWDPQGAARITMGPAPERGAAAEAFSFGAQMAGEQSAMHTLSDLIPIGCTSPFLLDSYLDKSHALNSCHGGHFVKYGIHRDQRHPWRLSLQCLHDCVHFAAAIV